MQVKLKRFEMWNEHPNEASQSSLLNRAQTLVFIRFNFSKRIYGIIFILCKTDNLEVFYKATVITLIEINFGGKRLTIIFHIGLLPAKFCPDFHFPSITRHERRKFLVLCLIMGEAKMKIVFAKYKFFI
jgi:hypothetical protein